MFEFLYERTRNAIKMMLEWYTFSLCIILVYRCFVVLPYTKRVESNDSLITFPSSWVLLRRQSILVIVYTQRCLVWYSTRNWVRSVFYKSELRTSILIGWYKMDGWCRHFTLTWGDHCLRIHFSFFFYRNALTRL